LIENRNFVFGLQGKYIHSKLVDSIYFSDREQYLKIEHRTNPELYQPMTYTKMPLLSCQALCSDFTKDIGYHIMKQYCPSCTKSD
jgi:hypothetical protein